MQENLAQQSGSPDAGLAHTQRIRLVDFWFEKLGDERDQYFAENRGPFSVFRGGEIVGKKGALE
jgi:hypothetical protein